MIEFMTLGLIISCSFLITLLTINRENEKERREMTPKEQESFETMKSKITQWANN